QGARPARRPGGAGPPRANRRRLPAGLMRAALLAVACLAAACDPRLYAAKSNGDEKKDEKDKDKDKDRERDEAPVSPLAARGATSGARAPGPCDEPLRGGTWEAGNPYPVVLEISGSVVELEPPFDFSLPSFGASHNVPLRALLGKLARLDRDKDVGEVLLR